jgi:hypothetical protein
MHAASKGLSNVGFRGRIRQILLLMGAIVLGVIISTAVGTDGSFKAKNLETKSHK